MSLLLDWLTGIVRLTILNLNWRVYFCFLLKSQHAAISKNETSEERFSVWNSECISILTHNGTLLPLHFHRLCNRHHGTLLTLNLLIWRFSAMQSFGYHRQLYNGRGWLIRVVEHGIKVKTIRNGLAFCFCEVASSLMTWSQGGAHTPTQQTRNSDERHWDTTSTADAGNNWRTTEDTTLDESSEQHGSVVKAITASWNCRQNI